MSLSWSEGIRIEFGVPRASITTSDRGEHLRQIAENPAFVEYLCVGALKIVSMSPTSPFSCTISPRSAPTFFSREHSSSSRCSIGSTGVPRRLLASCLSQRTISCRRFCALRACFATPKHWPEPVTHARPLRQGRGRKQRSELGPLLQMHG